MQCKALIVGEHDDDDDHCSFTARSSIFTQQITDNWNDLAPTAMVSPLLPQLKILLTKSIFF